MDGDSDRQQQKTTDSDDVPLFRYILQSAWLRLFTFYPYKVDGELLAFNFRILPAVGILLYIILLIF
jgi:hypothetical protein